VKIAHVADFYLPRLGGIEVHLHDLATRQRAAGHTVDIITSSPPALPGSAGELTAQEEASVLRIGDGLRWQHPLNPVAATRVHRVLKERDYDVVHAHAGVWSSLAFGGALAATKLTIPTVLTWHSLLAWAHPIYRLVDWTVGWSSHDVLWTAVSGGAAKPLLSLLPGGTEVGVLPNAVDVEDWLVDPVDRLADEVHLVAVMRLAPRKRPHALLKVLRQVRNAVPAEIKIKVSIVGEGPERPTMERYLSRHGLGDMVDLPGRRTRAEIGELYRHADAFIAPAKLESFGIAALEARCAGVPVVAWRRTGIADFVGHGEHGLLVDSDNEMRDALVRLCTEPTLRRDLAARSRAVVPPFGWPDALAGADDAYRRAAALVGKTLPAPVAAPAPLGR
jgi:glycosyltransferase involved in cell wall biosynthesis